MALQFVKTQTEEICLAATGQDPHAIKYLDLRFAHVYE